MKLFKCWRMTLYKFTKNMDLMAMRDGICKNSSVALSDCFFIGTGKGGEQPLPFLFYRSAVFAGR